MTEPLEPLQGVHLKALAESGRLKSVTQIVEEYWAEKLLRDVMSEGYFCAEYPERTRWEKFVWRIRRPFVTACRRMRVAWLALKGQGEGE